MPTRRRPHLALLAAVVLVGCGGSDDGPGPREVVNRYFEAFAGGDEDTACGLLAPAARTDMANYAKAVGQPSLSDCEPALRAIDRAMPSVSRSRLRRARVTALHVDGDRGTAVVRGGERPLPLARLDGKWRIARLDFRYQTFRVKAGQICTRFSRTIDSLPRPALTRPGLLTYLDGLDNALTHVLGQLFTLGAPPERTAAWDDLITGFRTQQRILGAERARLKAGAPVRSFPAHYARREGRTTRALNAAQATLEIRCGEGG